MVKTALIVILSMLLIIAAAIFAVDFVFYLKNKFCRYHIGKWKNFSDWQKAFERVAVKWVKKTPTVKITDNSRYMLFDMLSGKYRSISIQSWQKAALILGLLESGKPELVKAAREAARELLDESGQWKKKPIAVDCGMLSYAIIKASDDPQKIKPAMDYSLSLIKKNINEHGMVSYTGGKNNPEMYVDTLGLVCPFLALYANTYNCGELEEVAFNQLKMYHDYGLYKDTSLPNHAFNIETKLPLGVYGWGRGTAWYLIGLVDTYNSLTNEDYKNNILLWISESAENYAKYQKKDGGFGATLQRKATYDSSATASLAWFYRQYGVIFESDKYSELADKSIKRLMKATRISGKLDWCQGDTKGIGIFAQTYDIMPFAQGMALRAINIR
ncbi:MAG: glycoside hydrolase family 88 protein [Oscillospiraceae bacterium]